MKQIRKRLTYANVMSSIAVFVVLGGGAIAATQLPKNSVGTKQLKRNAVKTGKIAKQAVRGGKIANNAVSTGKIAPGAVISDRIADGAVTTGKIANDAVGTDKIANDAVTTGKIANDAVTTGKIANSAVTTGKLAAGSVKAGKLGTVTRRETAVEVPDGTSRLATATCLAGERAISGGGLWAGVGNATNTSQLHVVHSFPNATATNWGTRAYNGSGVARTFTGFVLCLQAG